MHARPSARPLRAPAHPAALTSASAATHPSDRPASPLLLALAVLAVAAIGGLFGPGPWYEALAKPRWTPPNGVFGPVWTLLYAMVFWAGWRVSRRRALPGQARQARTMMRLWWAQLATNGAWSAAFFGLQSPLAALAVIAVLLALIVGFAWRARDVDRLASALFLPYVAWVAFATALNAAIVAMNV